MSSKFYQFSKRVFVQKLPVIITFAIILSISSVLISYKDGPASHGEHVTGAPFDSSLYCTKCHGGGNFGASILAKLFRPDSSVVTAYTPGQSYYFVIIYKHTTGTPLHGFQTTSATTANGTNVNGWKNSLPAGTANRVVLGHNYIEHTAPFTADTVIIPWKAPAAGTGSITFYTACNFVNGNNKPTGDQPVKGSYVVAEGTASITNAASSVDVFAEKVKPDLTPGLIVYQHSGYVYMRYNNTGDNQSAYISLTDIQGRVIYTGKVSLNKGNNIFPVQSANGSRGIVIATIVRTDGVKTSKKIVLE